jgi:hypothetical protein
MQILGSTQTYWGWTLGICDFTSPPVDWHILKFEDTGVQDFSWLSSVVMTILYQEIFIPF